MVGHPEHDHLTRLSPAEQKRELRRIFAGAGWEADRLLREVDDSEELYVQKVQQIQMRKFTRDRVALVGDAGYCPTLGQGTTLAFTGAYILAGCLVESAEDVPAALLRYEGFMKPFIQRAQRVPPGLPWIANPQTWWGIRILYSVCWVVSLVVNSGLGSMIGRLFTLLNRYVGDGDLQLPVFELLR